MLMYVLSIGIPVVVIGALLVIWLKFKNPSVRSMKDPVQGTFQLTAVSAAPYQATSGNFNATGVVSGPGLAPTPIEHKGMAKVSKWPFPGMTLPVTVDRAEPTKVRIEWDQLPTARDSAMASAQRLAGMGGQPGLGGVGAPVSGAPMPAGFDAGIPGVPDGFQNGATYTTVTVNGQPVTGEAAAAAMAQFGAMGQMLAGHMGAMTAGQPGVGFDPSVMQQTIAAGQAQNYQALVTQGVLTQHQANLLTSGTQAQAVVMSLAPTGAVKADRAVLRLALTVTRPDGSTFAAQNEGAFPSMVVPRLQPGMTIPVRYLPGAESDIAIELH
jgi:hypothetical protein